MKQGTAKLAEVYCFIHEALRPVGKARRQIAAVPPSNSRPAYVQRQLMNRKIANFRFSLFLTISLCNTGHWRSHPVCSVLCHVFFQLLFPHVFLKLKSHGMGNSIINWIEQWLTGRRQSVIVDGDVSSWKSVFSEVPQGSVLI